MWRDGEAQWGGGGFPGEGRVQKDRVPLQGMEGARENVTDAARTGGRQCGDKCLGEAWGHLSCAAQAPPLQPTETTDDLGPVLGLLEICICS